MIHRTYFFSLALSALSVSASSAVWANDGLPERALTPLTIAQANTDQINTDLTDAEVRKVDMEAKKITLKHGEIKNLEMPAMTMVFQVKDAAMLEKVKPGDKIRFAAEKTGGAYTVTAIEMQK